MENNRSLTCRVCHNYLKGPIRQCAKDNAHNFCKSCIEKFDECVVCGGAVPFKIDPSIEKALLKQTHPCKFVGNGCQISVLLQDKANHEKQCIYRIYKCEHTEFTNSGNCMWRGPYNQINTHFRTHIKTTFNNTPVILPMKISDNKSFNFIQLVRQFNELFWFKYRIDCQKQKIFFLFQCIGTKQLASEFCYKIEIISQNDPNLKFEFTKYCLSDSENAMDAFNNENCGILSFKQAIDFIADDTILFNYFIKKKDSKLDKGNESQQSEVESNMESHEKPANRKKAKNNSKNVDRSRSQFKNQNQTKDANNGLQIPKSDKPVESSQQLKSSSAENYTPVYAELPNQEQLLYEKLLSDNKPQVSNKLAESNAKKLSTQQQPLNKELPTLNKAAPNKPSIPIPSSNTMPQQLKSTTVNNSTPTPTPNKSAPNKPTLLVPPSNMQSPESKSSSIGSSSLIPNKLPTQQKPSSGNKTVSERSGPRYIVQIRTKNSIKEEECVIS